MNPTELPAPQPDDDAVTPGEVNACLRCDPLARQGNTFKQLRVVHYVLHDREQARQAARVNEGQVRFTEMLKARKARR